MPSVLLVGSGRMGWNHRRILIELGHNVIVVDPDINVLPDFASLDDAPLIDHVIVCVPIAQLAQVATQVILRGPKYVLVEKPLAASEAEALELCKLAKQHDVKLVCGFTEVCNPAVRTLKNNVLPDLGPIVEVETRRIGGKPSSDYPAMLDLGVHDMAVLLFLGIDLDAANIVASYSDTVRERTLSIATETDRLILDYGAQTITRNGVRIVVPKQEPLRTELVEFMQGHGFPASGAAWIHGYMNRMIENVDLDDTEILSRTFAIYDQLETMDLPDDARAVFKHQANWIVQHEFKFNALVEEVAILQEHIKTLARIELDRSNADD